MCGILGGNCNKWNYISGIQSIYHRGPDAQKIEEYSNCTLAFTRLSIMDLSKNAMQPMTSSDGDVTIVFNGEIYGYESLKKELEKKYIFFSESDTEVILNLYLEYGDLFIDKIDGMFAIAIYDRRTMLLKLYRDRTGIKPLYYYYCDNQFAFASEIKALEAACVDVKWKLDYTALYDYLFYQYIPEPKTMYQNCFKLLPAHTLVYDLEKKKIKEIKKYWKLHINTAKGRRRKTDVLCNELRNILTHSVRKQLVADVPVGCFLSGGIDSSIISYECSQYNPNIHTYTIGFRETKYDESGYADMLIEQYHLKCKKEIIRYQDIAAVKNRLKEWYDEPFADTSAYPSYIVSKLAKQDVTVVLTGDGGDELFGGYSRYQLYADACKGKKINSKLISRMTKMLNFDKYFSDEIISKYINTEFENYLPFILMTGKEAVEYYRKKWKIDKDYNPYWHLQNYYKKELPPITRARYLDYKTYLPGDILTKVDRVSMANSLEARVPFLSRELVEFAFSLSEEECCNSYMLKKILKDTYKGIIPKAILHRKKRGFSVPPNYIASVRKKRPITCEILDVEWKGL